MKISGIILVVGLLGLSGCWGAKKKEPAALPAEGPPTTVLTFHVLAGKERDLEALLGQCWELYRQEHLVADSPHILLHGPEEGNNTRYVQIFRWVAKQAPENAPEAIQKIWTQEQGLCEARNGHGGIEGGELTTLIER